MMLRVNIRLRPMRSPKWAMMMPPGGGPAGGEDAEGLELAQPLGNVGREEELADDHGEEDEDDEVVEFEGAAQRRQAQGL